VKVIFQLLSISNTCCVYIKQLFYRDASIPPHIHPSFYPTFTQSFIRRQIWVTFSI